MSFFSNDHSEARDFPVMGPLRSPTEDDISSGNSSFTCIILYWLIKICGGQHAKGTIGISFPDVDGRSVCGQLHIVVFRNGNQHALQWQEGWHRSLSGIDLHLP